MGHKLVQSMTISLTGLKLVQRWPFLKNDLFKFDFRETISLMGHKLIYSMAEEL